MDKILIKLEKANGKAENPIEAKIHESNAFLLSLSPNILDLYLVGYSVFEVEKSLVFNRKIKKVTLPHVSELDQQDKSQLCNLLKQLFLFLYKKKLHFSFKKIELTPQKETSSERRDYDKVMLFSGGLDSTIGVNYCAAKNYNCQLVYIRHGNAGQLTPRITQLEENLIKPKKMNLVRIVGPAQKSGYFANTRGLLYLLTGAVFACQNKSPLIISECGVTMYQPRFGPLYGVTYTTHPAILSLGKEIIKIFTKTDLEVILPFENNTKAEMVKKYGDATSIASSFSCLRNLRFAVCKGNCGECYACLVRRLGIIAAIDDPTTYSEKNSIGAIKNIKENLYPIINFCYRVITDFDGLEYWQKERILKYDKKELFYRFALDTFIALEKISKKDKLPDWADRFLNGIDATLLQKRKDQLLQIKKYTSQQAGE